MRCKRIFDLIIIFPIFIVALPIFLILILKYAISMVFLPKDRGPIIHKVFRRTKGRLFLIYKFRVYRIDESKNKNLHKTTLLKIENSLTETDKKRFRENQRYWFEDRGKEKTFFGGLLKKFYLDELPQIVNIVKGDMTFVGPRPFALYDPRNLYDEIGHVYLYGKKTYYQFKDDLPAGLTGFYQLNKDYRAIEDYQRFMFEGIELDKKYHEKLSGTNCLHVVLLDLSIMIKTFAVIIRGEGI